MIPDWGPTTFFLNGGDPPDAEGLRKLAQRRVTVESATILTVEGSGSAMAGLRLANGRLVEIDALFLGTQLRITPLAAQLGCDFEDGPFGRFIRVDAAKMTTVLGVYAAGDNARAMHNATFASADGVLAGASLHQALMFNPVTA
jgi:thioredoxin reductase